MTWLSLELGLLTGISLLGQMLFFLWTRRLFPSLAVLPVKPRRRQGSGIFRRNFQEQQRAN